MTSSTNTTKSRLSTRTRWLFPLFATLLFTACTPQAKHVEPPQFDRQTDVIDDRVTVTNGDKFLDFLENVKTGTADKIRIVHYTIEGDPILQNLAFDGKIITFSQDDSHDKNGGGNSEQGLTCQPQITIENLGEQTRYNLGGCTSKRTFYLLTLPKEQK